jgi:SNF2 family DNA or RNA helicase
VHAKPKLEQRGTATMGRPAAAASSKASSTKGKGNNSVLQQLELLRGFVPREMKFSERDLTDCLSQCGYNVSLAAEKLVTGDYRKQKQKKGRSLFAAPRASSSASSSTPAPRTKAAYITPYTASIRKQQNTARRKDPPPTSVVKPAPTADEIVDLSMLDDEAEEEDGKVPASRVATGASPQTTPQMTSSSSAPNTDDMWLLCQRWISNAVCTSRRGGMDYQERLATEASGPSLIRLQGRSLEGRFPEHIGRLLNPLVRQGWVHLEAHSLLQEAHVPMGGALPVSLSVYLPHPRAFFDVFAEAASAVPSSAARMYWESKAPTSKAQRGSVGSLARAAFLLLQWAQYGDVPDFGAEAKAAEANDSTSNPDAPEDPVELEEDAFEDAAEDETTAQAREWAQSVTPDNWSARLPEAEDPAGFEHVELRSYQRQALHWMRQREVQGETRPEQEEQLALLTELARPAKQVTAPNFSSHFASQDIVCECGPVQVSDRAREKAMTCEGETNPLSHPLWQRRFLTDATKQKTLCFFVNELMGVASHQPPTPPQFCSGGILADAMGLGKTVMLLGLILRAKQEMPKDVSRRTTLVVAKLSLLPQWEEEIKSKTNLSYAVCYGSQGPRGQTVADMENVDVVLTTYGSMQGELKRKQPLLARVKWLRVILDEAHCVRNQNTLASKACCALDAQHRWAVSGTIMMNSMQDLFGIFKFLRHEPWCLPPFWKAAISKPMMIYDSTDQDNVTEEERTAALQLVLSRLRRVLSPLMLRRTKDSLTKDGKPILTLPPVETKVVSVELTPTEREFYQAVLARSLEVFEGFVDAGTAAKSYIQILSMISRLRQCCDHISLTVRSRLDEEEPNENVEDNTSKRENDDSKKPAAIERPKDVMGARFVESLLSKLSKSPNKRKPKNTAVEGTSPSPPKRPRDNYLASVAAALSDAVQSQSTQTTEECPICLENTPLQSAVLTPCGHVFCRDCLVDYLHENASGKKSRKCPDGICPVCSKTVPAHRIIALVASKKDPDQVVSSYLTAPSASNSPDASPIKPPAKREEDVTARTILQDAVLHGGDSSKMKAVLDELDKVWESDPGSKVLIFSQFLGFLDLLQPRLVALGIPYFRLDGQLSLAQRGTVLKDFRLASTPPAGPQKRGTVLLMSMSAGGEGLNLVSASSVFLVDPWWNAAKEDQCVNRIVRLGQTAAVCRVRKFVVRQSVEEKIVALQSRKQYVADELYQTTGRDSGGGGGAAARLTLEDLQVLFQT